MATVCVQQVSVISCPLGFGLTPQAKATKFSSLFRSWCSWCGIRKGWVSLTATLACSMIGTVRGQKASKAALVLIALPLFVTLSRWEKGSFHLELQRIPGTVAPHGGNLLRYWLTGIHNKTFHHIFLLDLLLGKESLKGCLLLVWFCFPFFILVVVLRVEPGFVYSRKDRRFKFWNMISLSCPQAHLELATCLFQSCPS